MEKKKRINRGGSLEETDGLDGFSSTQLKRIKAILSMYQNALPLGVLKATVTLDVPVQQVHQARLAPDFN